MFKQYLMETKPPVDLIGQFGSPEIESTSSSMATTTPATATANTNKNTNSADNEQKSGRDANLFDLTMQRPSFSVLFGHFFDIISHDGYRISAACKLCPNKIINGDINHSWSFSSHLKVSVHVQRKFKRF